MLPETARSVEVTVKLFWITFFEDFVDEKGKKIKQGFSSF